MTRPAHTIVLQPWRSTGFGMRLALDMGTMMLWPLQPDDRMSVLINLLAAQIDDMVEGDDQVDALVDVLRQQLRLLHAARTAVSDDLTQADRHNLRELVSALRAMDFIELTELRLGQQMGHVLIDVLERSLDEAR
jgi:hypothetical protein